MKDDESLPVSTPTSYSSSSSSSSSHSHSHSHSHTTSSSSKSSDSMLLLGRGRYKFWALAGILLLAFWSMFTGTVTLRWSAGNLNGLSDYFDIPLTDDLDVLEMEEREKLVKYMWDVYTSSPRIKLPKFWQEAFEAAYEELTSDVSEVQDSAISEISKMSLRFIHIDLPPLHSSAVRELSQKQADNKQRTATRKKL